MEEITEEVVSESSKNSVKIEKPVDGNVSVAEFADQLLRRKETTETEPEATTDEIDEPLKKLRLLRKSPKKTYSLLKIRKLRMNPRHLHNLQMFFRSLT